ncbi:MAG: hypothetical protein ACI9ON_001574 [Limisphaerales bacterium]|jgi:hypothetical protein
MTRGERNMGRRHLNNVRPAVNIHHRLRAPKKMCERLAIVAIAKQSTSTFWLYCREAALQIAALATYRNVHAYHPLNPKMFSLPYAS